MVNGLIIYHVPTLAAKAETYFIIFKLYGVSHLFIE